MTLNASGPISLGGSTVGQSINLELGNAATATASINSTPFRTLAGVPSGAIALSNFYGKSNNIPYFMNYMTVNDIVPYYLSNSQALSLRGNYLYSVGASTTSSYNHVWNKYNLDGTVVYSKILVKDPTITYTNGASLATDSSSNSYVFYATQNGGNYGVTKVNSSGAVVFRRPYTISNMDIQYGQVGLGLVDSADNPYILATSYVTTGPGYGSAAIVKLDTSGNVVWSKWAFNFSGYQQIIKCFTSDSSNNIYVGSQYNNGFKMDSSGNVVGNFTLTTAGSSNYTITSIAVDSSGNIYVVGHYYLTGCYITKMNSSFAVQWSYKITSPLATDANLQNAQVAVLSNGNLIVSIGDSQSNIYQTTAQTQPFSLVMGISSSGTLQWSTQFGQSSTYSNANTISNLVTNGSDSFYFYGMGQFGSNAANINPNNYIFPVLGRLPTDGSVGYGGWRFNSTQGVYYASTPVTLTAATTTVSTSTWIGFSAVTTTAGTNNTFTPADTTNSWNNYAINSMPSGYGSQMYAGAPGTYTWICPAGVTSVSVVCVGGGGGGSWGSGFVGSGAGGGGGALRYGNNITVTPGASYTVVVGGGGATFTSYNPAQAPLGGNSSFAGTVIGGGGAGGTYSGAVPGVGGTGSGGTGGSTGGAGGYGSGGTGGGGAGGYSGVGGQGAVYPSGASGAGTGTSAAGGGFTGISKYGQGAGNHGSGIGALGASGATFGSSAPVGYFGGSGAFGSTFAFGGGGGAGGFTLEPCPCCGPVTTETAGNAGSGGFVRIIWPGSSRTFPSTNI